MNRPRQIWVRIVLAVAAAAVVGLGVFGLLAWRATSVESLASLAAREKFDDVAIRFGTTQPRIILDPEGVPARNPRAPEPTGGPVKKLVVLAYRAESGKLVRTEVPFWFFRLKSPAANLALRNSGFDMGRLGLRSSDLATEGPGIIFLEMADGGDRLLVWAE